MKKKKPENLKLGRTEYFADGLYLSDSSKPLDMHIPLEEELCKNEDKKKTTSFLYDENSGNVHVFPENAEEAKKYAECIQNKQNDVRNCLKEKLEKKFKLFKASGNMPFAKGTNYEEAKNIFTHIHIQKDERNYDLMFIRFYKDKNNKKINCILKCLQFEMYTDVKSIDIYPDSEIDGAKTFIRENKPSFYYNPRVSFDNSAERIADEFLKFIAENEKKYGKER